MLDIAAHGARHALHSVAPEVFTWPAAADLDEPDAFPSDRSAAFIELSRLARAASAPQEPAPQESKQEVDARRWMVLIQSRDESGLRSLHAGLNRRVFNCALGIVHRDETAHEIVSTTFLQVWNNAARYEPQRGSVVAWVLLIARTRSFDALRQVKARGRYEIGTEDEEPLGQFDCEAFLDPLAHLERDRRRSRLQRALSRLSPMQRQVLALTTLEGLSQDEASRHLDIPLGTVKSHARRGLAALKLRCEATGLSWD